MQIQILGLRKWTPPDKDEPVTYDAFHDKNWRSPGLKELFDNLDKHIQDIPAKERWNIFYTVAHCEEGVEKAQKRAFKRLNYIVFDVDGIDKKLATNYIEVVEKTLAVDRNILAIVDSGNGLHFILETTLPIKSRKHLNEVRPHYKAVIKKLNLAFKNENLPGECDPAVWDIRRIMRLPATINRKPNKQDTQAQLICNNLTPIAFDLKKHSDLPDVAPDAQLPPDHLKKYPDIDTKAVKEQCAFMRYAEDQAHNLSEPAWYGWMSIAGKLEDGHKYVHEVSSRYPHYNFDETELKLEQALTASGPRTCKDIHAHWDNGSGCIKCPHWGKVTSPITLVGEGHIKTKNTGFHTIIPGKKPIPNYEDLRLQFEKDFHYKGLDGSRMVMVWKKTHYTHLPNVMIEEYAQKNFIPKANKTMRGEFRDLVQATNTRWMDWWHSKTTRKLNFLNGVLDLDNLQFSEHTPDIGFRYVLPYQYNPAAIAPVFTNMLKRVCDNDKEMISVLLEFMGYALSSDSCWAQKALVLVGDGANGKSTFMNVLKELAGAGNYGSATMQDLKRSEYSRQLLDGKLFNVSEETPTTAMSDSNLFKTLVTGGELQVRSPYKEPYYARSRAKLIFSCNDLPDAYENSYGFYRRFMIAEFKMKFTPQDPDYDPYIDEKLKNELSGIFNLAIKGYQRMKNQRGFSDSKKIHETTQMYQNETDTVKAWAMENMVVNGDDTKFAVIRDLYLNYKIFTEANGERPLTQNKFTRSLKQLIGGDEYTNRCTVRWDGGNKIAKRGLQGVIYGDGVGLSEMVH
jgi:P4 family phage/plasmid primase-like protien